MSQMSRVMLYSTLQCLDVMMEIRKLGFKNDPAVSSELVKFLSLNQEFQSIKDLQDITKLMRDEVKDARKEAHSVDDSVPAGVCPPRHAVQQYSHA